VILLTLGFLALYALGVRQAFQELDEFTQGSEAAALLDSVTVAGATLFGLSLFAILFLGAVLAVFLTLNVVRGDAERGLLQPLVVRPVGRTTLLLARFGAAAAVCAVYVWIVFTAALLVTHQLGDGWWPDRFVRPALGLAGAVVLVVALSVLGSAILTGTANGIAIFMLFGAGRVAGLLGQIGEALGSPTLERVATISSWVLPFEALYQDALHQISADSFGLTRVALQLGPFGGAEAGGAALWLYAAAYLGVVLALAIVSFSRRDL
jgi:ABC-type transport system involved in multi-copper enzyme maturation permease subunit